jgi:hypothetical protein
LATPMPLFTLRVASTFQRRLIRALASIALEYVHVCMQLFV